MEAGKDKKHPAAWTRPLRRLFKPFLSRADKDRITRTITEMESRTTAEIHVHVAGRSSQGDALQAAKTRFFKLGLHRAKDRDCVLIHVSHLDHRFAVWGDEGVHTKAGQQLWDRAAQVLREHFSRRRYAEGIEACVREVGKRLAEHFPRKGEQPGTNELPDEVSDS